MPRKQKDGPEAGAVERLNAQTGEAAVAVVAAADAAQPATIASPSGARRHARELVIRSVARKQCSYLE